MSSTFTVCFPAYIVGIKDGDAHLEDDGNVNKPSGEGLERLQANQGLMRML